MGQGSAELAVAGELQKAKGLFALSVLFTVVGGIVCVVCLAHMGLVVGLAPPLPAPPPPPPPSPLKLLLQEVTWWSITGV